MCGIAGIIPYDDMDIKKLAYSLKHRGPDAQAIYIHDKVALVQTRLAIQDVPNGVQPFHYANYTFVYNGEIYNHQELRSQLKEFEFQTQSDTETLLYLYIKYKEKMFDMLDGMFAFCIYDKNTNQLILARDRAGKKPLYYYHDNESFIFASELNAIKSIQNLSIHSDSIYCYLRTGLIWQPHTAYKNVFKLPSSSYLILDIPNLSYKINRYFDIKNYYDLSNPSMGFRDTLSKLEAHLKKSVADRITASDVEVGVFLSGGIDSNLIAALASQIKPNIKTFTVKFDGLYDESSLAKLTAQKYQTQHIELCISNNLKDDIEKILLSYGEPFMDSSAIPSYYVAREASKYVKVVLSGDGADELFAGYRRYVPTAYGIIQYFQFISPLLKFLPKPHTKQSMYNYVYRLLAIAKKRGLDFYLSATSDIFEDALPISTSESTQQLGKFVENILADRQLSSLKKLLFADYSIILFCDLLVKMDIASMANSLEVRSPFLSKYLLEFAPNIPDKYKIKHFKTKFILRKLAQKYLPKELIDQPKRGFEVPLKKWVNEDLREAIHDRLQAGCYSENYIDRQYIQKLLSNKINISAEKRAKMMWSLYCLEVWNQALSA